jgi:hypothetical protein
MAAIIVIFKILLMYYSMRCILSDDICIYPHIEDLILHIAMRQADDRSDTSRKR